MTLTLELSPELEQELLTAAAAAGLSVEVLAARWLAEAAAQRQRRAVVDLLQSWLDVKDATEQQETGQYLLAALDADRLSERPLFPRELRGISW